MRKRLIYWILQLVGWIFASLSIWFANTVHEPDADYPKTILGRLLVLFSIAFFGMVFSHLMKLLIEKLKWPQLPFSKMIPLVLVACMFFSFLGALGLDFTLFLIAPPDRMLAITEVIADAYTMLGLNVVWAAVYYSVYFYNESKKQEDNNVRLKFEKNEIELQVLRSQLNPHFLFNSLNTVRALVDINPTQAKKSVTHLANMLRKSLTSGKLRLITLREELEIVQEYLELEKARFEERLHIHWSHDQGLDNLLIPPFILQTLVENAVKHGVTKIIAGGNLYIITQQKKDSVCIRVENDGKLGSGIDTGIGVENTIRRLCLEYGNRAGFSLYENGNRVIAEIEIR